ncbi:MAG TPA: HIT family protein [Candidatus Nanoarchaeia archaeon]|nr:HIT family protein [Candidatus Nanoarchaeia archaeon]
MAETPFSPEQLQKLTEISRLPPEEQKKVLPDFLKTLSPEQVKYLQEQQTQGAKSSGPSCPFCSIVQKQLQAVILYEDDHLIAALDIRPATKGHTLLFPKHHVADFSSLPAPQTNQLFLVAQKLVGILEELEECQGVNLFLANGSLAGQTVDHVLVHLIPRYDNDGLHLSWQGKTATADELQGVKTTLESHLTILQPKPKDETPSQKSSSPAFIENDDEPFAQF